MWDLLFSAAGGGVLGLLGSGFKLWGKYKEKKLMFEHEVNMAKEVRLNMEMEIDLAKVKGTIELELQESVNDAKGLQLAIEAEGNITGVAVWVNNVRGMVRPVLTLMLVIFAFIKPDEDDIVFMASTAVTFWFGDRPRKSK